MTNNNSNKDIEKGRIGIENRYQEIYEENLNPFIEFNKKVCFSCFFRFYSFLFFCFFRFFFFVAFSVFFFSFFCWVFFLQIKILKKEESELKIDIEFNKKVCFSFLLFCFSFSSFFSKKDIEKERIGIGNRYQEIYESKNQTKVLDFSLLFPFPFFLPSFFFHLGSFPFLSFTLIPFYFAFLPFFSLFFIFLFFLVHLFSNFFLGAVKVTPGHDPNDYECGKRNNLQFINILNDDGSLNSEAGKLKERKLKKKRERRKKKKNKKAKKESSCVP